MPTAPSSTTPDPPASRKAADAAYFRAVLIRLIEVSADMVEIEHDQARAQAAYTVETGASVWPAPDRTVAIDRMARCIRRSISLAQRLDEPEAVLAEGHDKRRVAARLRIVRAVKACIERRVGQDEAEADALHDGLRERMDAPEVDDAIDVRPASEIIADICRSLGLATPPGVLAADRRTPEDIRTLWTRAAPGACNIDTWPDLKANGASVLLSEGRFRGK